MRLNGRKRAILAAACPATWSGPEHWRWSGSEFWGVVARPGKCIGFRLVLPSIAVTRVLYDGRSGRENGEHTAICLPSLYRDSARNRN